MVRLFPISALVRIVATLEVHTPMRLSASIPKYTTLILTRWPERLPLLRRPELLLHSLLKARLRQTRRAPNLQLDMLLVVDTMGEEHRGEIHVREVPAVERAQAVLGKVLNPFRARSVVLLGIGRRLSLRRCMSVRASVMIVCHRRERRKRRRRRAWEQQRRDAERRRGVRRGCL